MSKVMCMQRQAYPNNNNIHKNNQQEAWNNFGEIPLLRVIHFNYPFFFFLQQSNTNSTLLFTKTLLNTSRHFNWTDTSEKQS